MNLKQIVDISDPRYFLLTKQSSLILNKATLFKLCVHAKKAKLNHSTC
ncbi:MAG: hypothetical protein ACI9EW_003236 [Cellvibrionaceae bacterium]|jgi:hypothetical protein